VTTLDNRIKVIVPIRVLGET